MSISRATGRDDFRVAIVLGSGLSELAPRLVGGNPIPYSEIKGMPRSNVPGHEGALYFGEIANKPSLVFAGRAHLYEGHDAAAVTHAVRAAIDTGCSHVILTNGAGAVNTRFEVGSPCLISDHINLTGTNPLIGKPEFLDLSDIYSADLRRLARSVDPALDEGVYVGLTGPTYETPAEVRMLATLGADLVGMSTVLEAIAAHALGAKVLGISVVSNLAAGLKQELLDHAEVTAAAKQASARVERLIRGVVERLQADE